LDCELPELQRSLLDAHLRRCSACTAFEGEARWIASSLRHAPLEQFDRAVSLPPRRAPIRLRAAVQVASVVFVVVGVGAALSPGGSLLSDQAEEALLAAPLAEAVVGTESIRALRGDSVRHGEIAVLPETGSDPIGEAKPALPAIPA
jgi:hypothetical protein